MGKASSFYRLMTRLVLLNFCCGGELEWTDRLPVGTPRRTYVFPTIGFPPITLPTLEPPTKPTTTCPAVVGSCPSGEWTRYYDTDNPVNGGNDIETVDSIRSTFGVRSVCPRPTAVEVRLVAGEFPYSHGQNAIEISTEGFTCIEDKQPDGRKCNNYKIRFCCPSVVGKCPSFAQWTSFDNRDRPTATGDWETRQLFRPQRCGCAYGPPLAIEGRIVGSGQLNGLGYSYGGNHLQVSPNTGLVCQNRFNGPAVAGRPRCHDYKVRYCCRRRLSFFPGFERVSAQCKLEQ